MLIKLVFNNSGDDLTFRALNYEVVEYFIDCLNKANINRFKPTNKDFAILELIEQLDAVVQYIAPLFERFYEMPKSSGYGYLNQRLLNQLHWCFVKFSQLCNLYDLYQDTDVKNKLNALNDLIHRVESQFVYFGFRTEETVYFEHDFDKTKIFSNSPANLLMSYNYLGRSLFTKFINFDITNEFDDENSYNELVTRLNFNLNTVQTLDFSPEYLAWCKKLNKQPLGEYLNLGIIDDLPNKIHIYREITTRNILDRSTFSIHKG